MTSFLPKIGQEIVLEVDNTYTSAYRASTEQEKAVRITSSFYVGKIVPNDRFDPPQTICLTTGLKWFPVRCIEIANIISWFDKNDTKAIIPPKINHPKDLIFKVRSSKSDKHYHVTYRKGVWGCDCIAGHFAKKGKKDCRHIEEKKAEMAAIETAKAV